MNKKDMLVERITKGHIGKEVFTAPMFMHTAQGFTEFNKVIYDNLINEIEDECKEYLKAYKDKPKENISGIELASRIIDFINELKENKNE